jgi:hypothetical protein
MPNRVMVLAQGPRVVELETDNARVWTDFEEACQALAEANTARSSLSTNQGGLE